LSGNKGCTILQQQQLMGGGVLDITLSDKVCQWLAAGLWFSLGTPVSSTKKSDHHGITEILLKVALNTITLTPTTGTWCNSSITLIL